MLDDLKYIHERDAQDALGIAEKQWQQLEHEFDSNGWNIEGTKVENIVLAGMGGSALAALLSMSWPGYSVPFEVSRSYEVPKYLSKNSLFIASSYSGNTEETLASLNQAEKCGAQVVVITSGGKLADTAREQGYPLALLPSGYQPRHAVFYNYKALLALLDAAGITHNTATDLAAQGTFIKTSLQKWLPTVPAKDNQAKQIAQELMGKSPVVYAGPLLYPAAYKWKISFNENAKNVAWCNQYPEFNHNEFMGWDSHPVQKPYAIVDLLSSFDHPQIKKRFTVSERLLSGKRPAPLAAEAHGETPLAQLLWMVVLGDFVSLYLALLDGLNPTPVELIEKLKKELAK